ncbi:hypothetical protein FM106_28625 [Brachybacterium faecium]|nr:hypothetical protein FM106_28625 [Brachybacterium faecium]
MFENRGKFHHFLFHKDERAVFLMYVMSVLSLGTSCVFFL